MISEADIISRLNLGASKEVLANSPSSPLSELLQGLVQDVTDQLTAKVDEYNINASSNLRQSIVPAEVSKEGSTVSIGINADFYWKFVNYGVNGTEVSHGAPSWGSQPPSEISFHQSTMDWVRNRGITMPEQFNSYESFAWAIMKNIEKHGKEARPFFTDVVNDKLYEALQKPIEALLKQSITINIVEPWQ